MIKVEDGNIMIHNKKNTSNSDKCPIIFSEENRLFAAANQTANILLFLGLNKYFWKLDYAVIIIFQRQSVAISVTELLKA